MTDEQRIEEALLLRRAKFDRNDNPKVFSAWSWRDGVAWRDANPKKMTVLEMVQMLENILPSEEEIREFAKLEKLILAANVEQPAESDEKLRDERTVSVLDKFERGGT